MNEKSLETLEAWSKAKDFCLRIYREVLPLLPTEEKWNLNQRLRRAALSIPANLAEGYGRFYYQDNVRFCYNARGSLQEVVSHLRIAAEMHYIPTWLSSALNEDAASLINGYIAYLKRSKQGENEPGSRHSAHESSLPYDLAMSGSPNPERSMSTEPDPAPSDQ